MTVLLDVGALSVSFPTPEGPARAVEDVTFSLQAGERVALVGESGSGKSVLARALLHLVPHPGRIVAGHVRFEGSPLAAMAPDALRALRGARIALIPQEPAAALHPTMSVGDQLEETLRAHGERSRPQRRARALRTLERVGFAEPERIAASAAHQLSGGMRQRVLIAMALLLEPAVVIADEPTTALDVTVQEETLALLQLLQRETGMAVLMITHDVGVVARFAERVLVMYAGQLVEDAPLPAWFAAPAHPYARALLASVPRLDGTAALSPIAGAVPSPRVTI
ncbi:MAG: ABC transporter ATP-binding protein, partial [Gemmatimonadaceae bacterium]|nr:ABC transporter ATP-binding protein [Gemmatimonadaceae bacterium]